MEGGSVEGSSSALRGVRGWETMAQELERELEEATKAEATAKKKSEESRREAMKQSRQTSSSSSSSPSSSSAAAAAAAAAAPVEAAAAERSMTVEQVSSADATAAAVTALLPASLPKPAKEIIEFFVRSFARLGEEMLAATFFTVAVVMTVSGAAGHGRDIYCLICILLIASAILLPPTIGASPPPRPAWLPAWVVPAALSPPPPPPQQQQRSSTGSSSGGNSWALRHLSHLRVLVAIWSFSTALVAHATLGYGQPASTGEATATSGGLLFNWAVAAFAAVMVGRARCIPQQQ